VSKSSVCIVLINWNQLELTLDCLESLSLITYSNFKVVLVDNASRVNPTDQIKEKYPSTIVLRQAKNLGFAEGNNVGFQYAWDQGFDYIMALNNDTVVDPDFLAPLLAPLQNNESDAVSPKIYFKHAPKTIWALGGRVNHLRVKGKSNFRKTLDTGQFEENLEPDYLTGCCLLIRSERLKSFGGFDPRYFAYYEDTDLSYRMRASGLKLKVITQSIIWHVAGGSSRDNKKKPPFLTYLGTRNRLYFFRNHTKGIVKMYSLTYIFTSAMISALFYLITFRAKHSVQILKGLADGMGN